MIIKRLVRSYFEQHLNFDGIEKTNFYKDIVRKANNMNASIEDYLYDCIFMGKDEVNSINPSPRETRQYADYIKLISDYFKYSNTLYLELEDDTTMPLQDFMTKLRLESYQSSISKVLNSAETKFCIKRFAPKWKKADVESPIIMLGTVYYNNTLSVKERNEIIKEAFADALFNTQEVSIGLRNQISDFMKVDNVRLAETRPIIYKELLKLCLKLNMAMPKLLSLAGFNYIDTLAQYQTFGCSILAHSTTSVKVIGKGSASENDYVILNNADFKRLYESGYLKTLVWEAGLAKITTNRKVPLFMALDKDQKNDLR